MSETQRLFRVADVAAAIERMRVGWIQILAWWRANLTFPLLSCGYLSSDLVKKE
jgi:hypothetical protein